MANKKPELPTFAFIDTPEGPTLRLTAADGQQVLAPLHVGHFHPYIIGKRVLSRGALEVTIECKPEKSV